MSRPKFRPLCFLYLLNFTYFLSACHQPAQSKITIGSKFFTEQVVLAELLAQHIEARTGIPVIRKTNLGGTLLVHKALQAGELDLYVEYTGTALTTVLNEAPQGDSSAVYNRVKQLYADRFHLEVTEPLGLLALARDRHYLPPYDAVPIVRQPTLAQFPQLRAALAELAGKLSAADIRRLNYAVDAQQHAAAAVVRAFRQSRGF